MCSSKNSRSKRAAAVRFLCVFIGCPPRKQAVNLPVQRRGIAGIVDRVDQPVCGHAHTGLTLCYNGDLLTPADVSAAPNVPLMFGRGLQADPSLLRRLRGGERASAAELQAFHDAIYTAYRRDYSGDVPVLHRMRELWNYLAGSFRNTEPLLRAVRKAHTCAAYEQAVRPFFARAEMIRE